MFSVWGSWSETGSSSKFTRQILTEPCFVERVQLMKLGIQQGTNQAKYKHLGACDLSVGRGRQQGSKYVTHWAEMSTRRRSGTVVNTVQCQEGEGITHEEGGVTGEVTGPLVQGSVTSEYNRKPAADIIPLMCFIVQRLQQCCSGQQHRLL